MRAAEANLTRLDDVLATMAAQLGALKKQARQAQRYRRLAEHIRRAEAMLFHLRWHAAESRSREPRRRACRRPSSALPRRTARAAASAPSPRGCRAALPPLRQRRGRGGGGTAAADPWRATPSNRNGADRRRARRGRTAAGRARRRPRARGGARSPTPRRHSPGWRTERRPPQRRRRPRRRRAAAAAARLAAMPRGVAARRSRVQRVDRGRRPPAKRAARARRQRSGFRRAARLETRLSAERQRAAATAAGGAGPRRGGGCRGTRRGEARGGEDAAESRAKQRSARMRGAAQRREARGARCASPAPRPAVAGSRRRQTALGRSAGADAPEYRRRPPVLMRLPSRGLRGGVRRSSSATIFRPPSTRSGGAGTFWPALARLIDAIRTAPGREPLAELGARARRAGRRLGQIGWVARRSRRPRAAARTSRQASGL